MKRGPIKQLIIFGLAVALIFTLTSCGKGKKDTAPTDQEETTSSVLTNEQESDSPHRDSSEPITTPLETDYFSLSFPDEWCTDCCYEIQDNAFGSAGYTVKFKMNQAYCGNYDGWLFSLCVTDDYSTYYERYDDYVGLITVGEGKQLYLIAEYPSGIQVEAAYNDLYERLSSDIPQILSGIWVTSTNSDYIPAIRDTAENQVEENDIPFIAAWSDKLDKPFSPPEYRGYGTIIDVLIPDGEDKGLGEATIYGLYEVPGVRYYYAYDEYYGSKDGTVVYYMNEVFDYERNVHFYVGPEFDSTPPKIINFNGCNYLEWEIINGYLVLETLDYGTSIPYTEWKVLRIMHFKDRDMCILLSPNIDDWVREQDAKAAAKEAEVAEKKNLSEDEQITLLQEMCRLGTYASSSTSGYEIAFLSIDSSDISLNIRKTDLIDKTIRLSVNDLRYYLDLEYDPYFIVEATDGSEAYSFTIKEDGFQAVGFGFILDIDYSFDMGDYYEY